MNYTYAVVVSEAVSILIAVILLYGNLYETRRNSEKITRKIKIYSALIITDIIGLLADMISWIWDGDMDHQGLLEIVTGLSLVITYVLIGEFGLYMGALIGERKKINELLFKLFHIATLVAIAVTAVMYKMGLLFTVVDGYYEEASLYSFYSTVNGFFIVAIFVIIVYYRKILGVHDIIAITIYTVIPVISSFISVKLPDISLGYTAATISLLVIYVMLQADNANRIIDQKNISSYRADHDELTGLLSRRVYVEKLDEISRNENDTVGVFFADVNGLKKANDRFGHIAGDKLLVQFADTAKNIFKEDEIYRISGDEFVMILSGINKNALLKKTVEFENALNIDGVALASFGVEYGNGKMINELIRMAESQMYAKKEDFYVQHPEMKR